MLLTFRVRNWGSLFDPFTFSMRASREQAFKDTLFRLRNKSVLPVGAIFGANASGKSQFVKALQALRALVINNFDGIDYGWHPHLGKGSNTPCEFLIEFAAPRGTSTEIFVYEVRVFNNEITFEELSRVGWENEFVLYRRTEENSFAFFEGLEDDANTRAAAQLIRKNETLLSKLAASDKVPTLLEPVTQWFYNLTIIRPDNQYAYLPERVMWDEYFRTALREFLSVADTGIEEICFTDVKLDAVGLPQTALNDIRTQLRQSNEHGSCTVRNGGDSYILDIEEGRLRARQLVARHRTGFTLPLRDESDGTVRFLDLLPILLNIRPDAPGSVVVIDELENSLHTVVTKRFVSKFIELAGQTDPGSQLVFTTHETSLMNANLLRRDEMWLVEKQDDSSTLHRVSDFRIPTARKGNNLEKLYLDGRLGAITRSGEVL